MLTMTVGQRVPNTQVREILLAVTAGGGSPAGMAERLCHLATERVAIEGAGLSLISPDGVQAIVAATSGPAHELEELQFATGEGPCVDASRTGRPVLQSDLMATGPQRWPGFAPAALGLALRAVFAFPLQIGVVKLGALDLYRGEPGRLTSAELALASAFADAATRLLLHAQATSDGGTSWDGLLDDVDIRAEVHQATGMISVQLGVSLAEALLRLRAHSYAEGRSIIEAASSVVNRKLRFGTDGASDGTTERGT